MSEASSFLVLANLTFVRDVRESGRSREVIRPELKRFLSLRQWTWSRHEVATPH